MKLLRLFILLLILMMISRTVVASDITLTSRNISYKDWGTYYSTWYNNKMYFAGYSKGLISEKTIFTFNITPKSGQLHSVLRDENINHQIKNGDQISLQEGYFLKINDIDVNAENVLVTLMKNGSEFESKIIVEGENYIFLKNIGNVSDLPIIAIHFENVINGPIIFIDGIFQISEDYVFISSSQTPAPTPTATPVNLKIDTQEEAIHLRMATIKITYYGMPVSNARVDYDGDMIGETDNNGTIEFVLESTGIHTITASKTGYNNGSKIVVVVTPKPTMKPTPVSTSISNTLPLPVGTTLEIKEAAIYKTTLKIESDYGGNSEKDNTYNILTGIGPPAIAALILIGIIIISKIRKRA